MYTAQVKRALEFFGAIEADKRIERACMRYLSRQPFTLWGDFDISSQQRRAMAANWLTLQWEQVGEEMRARDWIKAFGASRRRRLANWLLGKMRKGQVG